MINPHASSTGVGDYTLIFNAELTGTDPIIRNDHLATEFVVTIDCTLSEVPHLATAIEPVTYVYGAGQKLIEYTIEQTPDCGLTVANLAANKFMRTTGNGHEYPMITLSGLVD